MQTLSQLFPINKTIPVPLYYQLKQELLNHIKNHDYQEGDLIPKEQDFCGELNLSRTTVRQAITELVYEGYLYRVKGKGTYVAKAKLEQDFIWKLESYQEQMNRLGLTPSTKVLAFEQQSANEDVANALSIDVGSPVIFLHRLRFADSEPIVVLKTYLPYDSCSQLFSHDMEQESLYSVLKKYDATKICHVSRTMEAILADTETAIHLQESKASAVLQFTTIGSNAAGTPIEYSIARYKGSRSKFSCC